MYSLTSELTRLALADLADCAPPKGPDHAAECFDVIAAVDDASAFCLGSAPMHVEPFFPHGARGEKLSEYLSVTVRYGVLASSHMYEVDTEAMVQADTWMDALTVLIDRMNTCAADIDRVARDLGVWHATSGNLQDTSLTGRLCDRETIRSEADDNPNLTDAERAHLSAASDADIDAALEQCGRGIEDRLFALHDELQSAVVRDLTSDD